MQRSREETQDLRSDIELIQESIPESQRFKTNLWECVLAVKTPPVASKFPNNYIDDIIKNGTCKPIDLLLIAGEMGVLESCQYIIVNYPQELANETKDTNLLLAIARGKFENRDKLLSWLLSTYDILPIYKPFTRNHILGAMGHIVLCEDKDNLGLKPIHYFIAGGHTQQKQILDFRLTNEDFLAYLKSPLPLLSLYNCILIYGLEYIDFNYQGPAMEGSIAWYIAHLSATGFDSSNWNFLNKMYLQNPKIDLKIKGPRSYTPKRYIAFQDCYALKNSYIYSTTKTARELLSTYQFDIFECLLMANEHICINESLKISKDYDLKLNRPFYPHENAPPLSWFIKNHQYFFNICLAIFRWRPENIIEYCRHLSFYINASYRTALTFVLLQLNKEIELKELLQTEEGRVIKYSLTDVWVTLDNLGQMLIRSNTSKELISLILDRIREAELPIFIQRMHHVTIYLYLKAKKYDVVRKLFSNDIDLKLTFKSNEKLLPDQKKWFYEYILELNLPEDISAEIKKRLLDKHEFVTPTIEKPIKQKPKLKPTQIPSIPINVPALVDNRSPQEKITAALEAKFPKNVNKITPSLTINKNAASIHFSGDKESIQKLSQTLKNYPKHFDKVDRSKIDKGTLEVHGKLAVLCDLFTNNTPFSSALKPFSQQTTNAASDKATTGEPKVKEIIKLDGKQVEQFIKELHSAFCHAEEVKITYDAEQRYFLINVEKEKRSWHVKVESIRHVEQVAVDCDPEKIENYIISRVISYLKEVKEVNFKRTNNQIIVMPYDSFMPSSRDITKQVESQFLQWSYTAKKKEATPTTPITFFQPSTTPPNPIHTDSIQETQAAPDELFKKMLAQLTGLPMEKFKFLKIKVIHSAKKYEYTYSYAGQPRIGAGANQFDTLWLFSKVQSCVNKYSTTGKEIISIQCQPPQPISIRVFATSEMLDKLMNSPQLNEDFKTILRIKDNDKQPIDSSKKEDFSVLPEKEKPKAGLVDIPVQKETLAESQSKRLDLDREAIRKAIESINHNDKEILIGNIFNHIEKIRMITESETIQSNQINFYAYLYHATRLSIFLAHLSFNDKNPDNIFYALRNILRHAIGNTNFSELHKKVDVLINFLMNELKTFVKGTLSEKLPPELLISESNLIELRVTLLESQVPKYSNKKLLQFYRKEQKNLLSFATEAPWLPEANIMLEGLIEQHTSQSERLIYKQIGHNHIEKAESHSFVVQRNLYVACDDLIQRLDQQIKAKQPNMLPNPKRK